MKKSRFVEHEKHVDIEEYYDNIKEWVVVKCSLAFSKALGGKKYSGTEKQRQALAVKAHYYKNRDAILNRQRKNAHKRYGLTDEQYQNMKIEQGGKCAICGKQKMLVIDHSHESGEVRGLLCTGCNVGIGLLQDSAELLKKAASYLTKTLI